MNEIDINDFGTPGTLQRLIYRSARTSTPPEWRALNNLAHDVLEDHQSDNEVSYLVNALCVATHKVVTMQRLLQSAIDEG